MGIEQPTADHLRKAVFQVETRLSNRLPEPHLRGRQWRRSFSRSGFELQERRVPVEQRQQSSSRVRRRAYRSVGAGRAGERAGGRQCCRRPAVQPLREAAVAEVSVDFSPQLPKRRHARRRRAPLRAHFPCRVLGGDDAEGAYTRPSVPAVSESCRP